MSDTRLRKSDTVSQPLSKEPRIPLFAIAENKSPMMILSLPNLVASLSFSLLAAIDIQAATRATKFFNTILLKAGGHKIFRNESFYRCDRFCQIFVQIGTILAISRPFEISHAV